mgnify:CR=1 FL=1
MKFRLKITFCMVCLMAVLFGIGSSALIVISFRSGLEREREAAKNSYRMLLYTLQMTGELQTWSSTEEIQNLFEQISAQGESWAAIRLWSQEEELYSSGNAAVYFGDSREEADPQRCVVTCFADGEGQRYLQLSGAFLAGDQTLYLDMAHNITMLYQTRAQQQAAYRRVFLGMTVLCAALAYTMALVLTRSLSRLSRGAREIAEGNFSFRSGVRSGDEIGRLSEDFDRMAGQVEQNILELKESVERQERFVSSFTHELKTPMTAVIGYADLLRSQDMTEEERRDAANYIFSEGKRLERLSLKLLDIYVADRQELALSEHSPGRIAQDMTEHLEPGYRAQGIALECRWEKGRCMLEPDLFRSLLMNLLDNARKALAGGGTILVTVELTGEGCRLTVADDGPGIPKESLERLTEAFYRVDKSRSRQQGGAGLGLTLCAKIAQLHRGTLSFDSQEGQGTKVTAELKGGRL